MDSPATAPHASEDLPQRLILAGYASFAGSGFALPCYGVRRLPNQWYVAECSPSGDPEGRIVGFHPSELSGISILEDAKTREVGLGALWTDVFIWNDEPYVGTREELWSRLEPVREDISARAPLSGLDLAFGADAAAAREMAKAGVAYLTKAYGASYARDWRRQVARTRFLTRLAQAGVSVPPRFLELTGAGAGRNLFVDAPEWAALPEAKKDVLLRAAEATARELDLKLRAPATLRPPILERPSIHREQVIRRMPEVSPEPLPEPPRLHHDAVGLSILLITHGPRATKIGRAAKVPDWRPMWSESDRFAEPIVRTGASRERWLPWIEVRAQRDRPDTEGYGVVVVLADDQLLEDQSARLEALDKARLLAGPEGVVILAPALPEEAPSRALRPDFPDLGYGADLVLDTAVARSPMWGTAERLSLDRRICDLVITAAQACLPGNALRRRVISRRGKVDAPRLASLAIWNPEEFTDAYEGEASFLSESHVPAPSEAWLDEYIPLQGRRKAAPAARLTVGDLRPEFEEYVEAVLSHFEARGLLPRGDLWRMPFNVPPDLHRALRRPDLAAGFRVQGPQAAYCALLAETPTLEALDVARRHGWLLARATDVSGLRRLARHDLRRTPIPTEVVLPALRRFQANRRLATRGVDTRDVVRIPAYQFQSEIDDHPNLQSQARLYLPARSERVMPHELAIPVRTLEEAGPSEFAQRLLTRFRSRGATAKRLADLSVLWSPPAFRRYTLEDGRLPPRIREIDGHQAVPTEACFAVDGDDAVPTLLGSCVFAVWARLTRSRGNGWTQRFAVSRTFETFPILFPFEPVLSTTGALALLLRDTGELGQASRRLASFVPGYEDEDKENAAWAAAREETDVQILHVYGLPPDASELDIANRLLELNRTLPDEASREWRPGPPTRF